MARLSGVARRSSSTSALKLLLASLATGTVLCETSRFPVDAHGQPISLPDEPDLEKELRKNLKEHDAQCSEICSKFFCDTAADISPAPMDIYPSGYNSVDFDSELKGSKEIYVTKVPLFTAEECDNVIAMAEREGLGLPTAKSGKYQVGKEWIKDMPEVLKWFNSALEQQLFPHLAALFPKLVSSSKMLRAHSVAVLKYNSTHPRTDVHVDDALLAFTVALSPSSSFVGGGTFFEHLGKVVDMEQGHVTFRPGSVRHAGAEITSGLRYVIGGFIALEDRVEHVRRLNERGNRLALSGKTEDELEQAIKLFTLAQTINPDCILCHANLGDAHLRLDRNAEAEAHLRKQVELIPKDGDAYYSLGVALRSQDREAEAVGAYQAALEIEPNDFQCRTSLAAAHGTLGNYAEEKLHYKLALKMKPDDVKALLNLGISHSSVGEDAEAEAAFRAAAAAGPTDARPPLNLGRFLAKLSRPAEAISSFYDAAANDAEYFGEVKLGVGTARAQQGRFGEATASFQSAHRMDPTNEKLTASLQGMTSLVERLSLIQGQRTNAVADLCGTPCQDVVDMSSISVCAITWRDGCGDAAPPAGFTAESSVGEFCAHACAAHEQLGDAKLKEEL